MATIGADTTGKTKSQLLADAASWLQKAMTIEAKPDHSKKMVDMALDRACAFETAAFDGRA